MGTNDPTERPRLVRGGDVPLPGAAEGTRLVTADPEGSRRVPDEDPDQTHLRRALPDEPQQTDVVRAQEATAGPVERFQAPPPPPPPRRPPWRTIARLVAAACILGIGVGVAVERWPRDEAQPLAAPSLSGAEASHSRGDLVVKAYLDALSRGDARAALALGPAPRRGSLLLTTNAAYSATRQEAQISDVQVAEQPATATSIPATYLLGGRKVSATFHVRRDDQGAWRLVRTTRTVRLLSPRSGGVPLRLNGVEVSPGTSVEVLPGVYRPTTGRPWIDHPPSDELRIEDLGDGKTLDHTLGPVLTEAGRRQVLEVGRRALSECLASTSLAPSGCPFRGTGTVQPGSVRWSLVGGDPFDRATPVLSASRASQASVAFTLTVKLSARTPDGATSPNNTSSHPVTMAVPITGTRDEKMPVTWSW